MNKLTLLSLALAASPSYAEVVTILQKVPCNEWKLVSENLVKNYGEIPAVTGITGITGVTDKTIKGELVVFMNPETRTYTLVVRLGSESDSPACAIAAGDEMGAADGKEYDDLRGGSGI